MTTAPDPSTVGDPVTFTATVTAVPPGAGAPTGTSSPDPSVTGRAVTFTATVAPTPPGAGVPTGTVTFDFGDGTATATASLSGGVATVVHSYTTTTGSPFVITATYNGTENFATSSGTDTQTVNKAATTTAVSSSPNPSTTGDQVTVTATVTAVAPGSGTPAGTVTLAITERAPQVVTLVNGTASATFNPLQKGTHTVTANYNGDVNYATSSATTTQTVNTGPG
ncbi:Ig-like domain-containing protein [Streptomyces melanosporofaciens]|uniref:Ig-like domain-containing protein n=1 Tax=Streptomyces melanosporofaciens TaxID=67327 RepID=UPI00142FFA7B|nr:Ig-like domain-containing protein [Streptomyces melanosporofaciens]